MLDVQDKQEIIIIKRGGGDGDGHHGGAWKIAFADFMTAMMALFLVLWLVNAANEETKKSVASYFNPVKLVDRNRSLKGLVDPKTGSGDDESKKGASGEEKDSKFSSRIYGGFGDSELFQDPFRVLDEIATSAKVELASNVTGIEQIVAQDGQEDAFADPFAPQLIKVDDQQNGVITRPEATNKIEKPAEKVPADKKDDAKGHDKEQHEKEDRDRTDASESEPLVNDAEKMDPSENSPRHTEVAKSDPSDSQMAEIKLELAAEVKEEVSKRLLKALGDSQLLSESVSVRSTGDGVLISITDRLGFSMFQVGSAVPKGQLVLAMKEISDVLSSKPGGIRIYGHTDGQPYAKGGYDNWNLSTARAHSARFMLARGGLSATRISQVAGFADRKLIDKAAPASAANRRIEILLEIQ